MRVPHKVLTSERSKQWQNEAARALTSMNTARKNALCVASAVAYSKNRRLLKFLHV